MKLVTIENRSINTDKILWINKDGREKSTIHPEGGQMIYVNIPLAKLTDLLNQSQETIMTREQAQTLGALFPLGKGGPQ